MRGEAIEARGSIDSLAGIRVHGFRAGYADREVVHDVSLALPAGQVSVLVGPGGSGKTTLVKALLGRSSPRILWRAGRVDLPGPDHRVQWQTPLAPETTLETLIAPSGTRADLVSPEAEKILRRVWSEKSLVRDRLQPWLATSAGELAAWYFRLAAFTGTIASSASLYVFDEPDADLPGDMIGPLADRIRELAPLATVLLVTHNLSLAQRVGDFVVLMIDGKIIEADESRCFFHHPTHERTRDFVRLGC